MLEKKGLVEKMAQALLEKEVLNLEQLEEVLGKRPFKVEGLRNIDKYAGNTSLDNISASDEDDNAQGGHGADHITDEPAVETVGAASDVSSASKDDEDEDEDSPGAMKPTSVKKTPQKGSGTLKPGTA